MSIDEKQAHVFDLVGVGLGPSNLALAAAAAEHNERQGPSQSISSVFLERQPCFSWHRAMLIDGATVQVSFLKDLVTIRNPRSRFSFIVYLHSKGRLVDFIDHKSLFPSRVEYHDYLEWAANGLPPHFVQYGAEVIEVRAVDTNDAVDCFDLVVNQGGDAGELTTIRTRNVVFGLGRNPSMPPGVVASDRVWHSSELLDRLATLPVDEPRCFIVVGAGQSAAETTEYLHRRYSDTTIRTVFTRYAYNPIDDTPYANRLYGSEAVDIFYAAPSDIKEALLEYHRNTNYSVVEARLIDELYRRAYQEKVRGEQRLFIHNVSRVVNLSETSDGVLADIEFLPTRERNVFRADVLIYATGYQPVDPADVLGDVGQWCVRDGQGRLQLGRDYRVETMSKVRGGIYVQGGTERSHGISSSALSNIAVRAGEILESILKQSASVLDGHSCVARAGRA